MMMNSIRHPLHSVGREARLVLEEGSEELGWIHPP